MSAVKQKLLRKLDKLPDTSLLEVLKYVEKLPPKSKKQQDPILTVVGSLSGKPISAKEIESELYGVESPQE